MAVEGNQSPSPTHPFEFLRRGGERAAMALADPAVSKSDYDLGASREISRRSFLTTAGGLLTIAAFRNVFNEVDANDNVSGDHHFTAQNIERLGIRDTKSMLVLAGEMGYLPTETANSKYNFSDFVRIADRANLTELRQYFRVMEILRNDGYFTGNDGLDDVHNVISHTPEITPVLELLFSASGARAKDGSNRVVHGLTHKEFTSMLENFLPNRFDFPYDNDRIGKAKLNQFLEFLDKRVNFSLQERGLKKEAHAILVANKK